MWMDVYDAVTTKAGRYVQGGGCATVGVAGLIQSGGFGSFSKRYGLAAAGLLQAEVVTADGTVHVVNRCRNPDLFWAIKGGGGGSFGVITKVTLRTHDLPDRFGGLNATIKADSDAAIARLINRFVNFYADALFNSHWGESVRIRPDNTLEISMACEGLDTAQATELWRPFFDWVSASPQDFTFAATPSIGSIPAQAWWDAQGRRKTDPDAVVFDDRPDSPPAHAWWAGDQDQVSAFLHGYESVWLPASLLDNAQRPRLADALLAANRHISVSLHFNKGLAGAPPEAISAAHDTAINPAALDAFALAIIATGGPPPDRGLPGQPPDMALARSNALKIDEATHELRRIAPVGGSYVSESNYFNRSWQNAFWGHNYARLRTVKEKYDPEGLFFVHHGVGSEDWSADGFVRIDIHN